MIRVTLETLVIGGIGGASLLVLRPMAQEPTHDRVVPICVGPVEAAAIGKALSGERSSRPMTHSLLGTVIATLGGSLESVSIVRVSGTIFYATLDVRQPGALHHVDARPSDAIALAIRLHVPIYLDERVLEVAGFPAWVNVRDERERAEIKAFHEFVEDLSPEDFARIAPAASAGDGDHDDGMAGDGPAVAGSDVTVERPSGDASAARGSASDGSSGGPAPSDDAHRTRDGA